MRKLILKISLTTLLSLATWSSVSAEQPPFTVELIQTFDYPKAADEIQGIEGINGQGDVAGTLPSETATLRVSLVLVEEILVSHYAPRA